VTGLLALVACTPAGTSPILDSGTPDSAPEEAPWWEEPRGDADGDGVSAEQGDCDELRADVQPGAADDSCDGVDQDCDGAADDGWAGDPLEGDAPTTLGDLGQGGEVILLAHAFPDGDQDAYAFTVEDADLAIFDIEAWVYDVPAGVDVALTLEWSADPDGVARGVVASADARGAGGDELLEWPGEAWQDDGGAYTLRVTARGGDCARAYLLQLLVGSW
jgi:hypothetical protein